jgi:hypothetical protein
MTHAPLILYVVLFITTVIAPIRWSIISFLLLSNIDLGSLSASIGLLNTAKAMLLPVYLLWRLRAYAGHERIRSAPVAWALLTFYVAIASSWSLYPAYAIKLIGHMIGSLIICLMLVRATKGGYLDLRTIVPVTSGVIAMAVFHWLFLHNWGGETERFTTFSGAQAFAAFAAALYCAVLPSRLIRFPLRITLCSILATSVLLNGSRIWIIAVLVSTLLSVFVSEAKLWIKTITFGATAIVAATLTIQFGAVMDFVAHEAPVNRIAAAITAAYRGNLKARGLGTYNLREELFRRTFQSLEDGSTTQLLFGRGTCNGALITATLSKNPDPNRAMHNEWLRSIYEWGITGLLLWAFFIGSLFIYAVKGLRGDRFGYSKPLLIYLPAFILGLAGENIIAGAGNAVSVGLLILIAFASISHRVIGRANARRISWLYEQEHLSPTTEGLVRAT